MRVHPDRRPELEASCRVRWATAALVTLYQPMPGSVSSPPTDEMLMIAPAGGCRGGPVRGLGRGEHPELVDLDGLLRLGRSISSTAEEGVTAGVVDQDVEAAEALHGRRHARLGLSGVTGVGGEATRPAVRPARPRRLGQGVGLRDEIMTEAPASA